MSIQTKVTGVILAGGLGRRMNNQDKGLLMFRNRPLVSYGVEAMISVADQTVINANRNIDDYRQFGLPVIRDQGENFEGPLAGVLSAMQFAKEGFLLVLPCDSPFFSSDYLRILLDVLDDEKVDIAVAADVNRLHPVFLALKVSLKDSLEMFLAQGQRKVEDWLQYHQVYKVMFDEPEIFANINDIDTLITMS